MKIETVLIALDFSDTALEAARWAIQQLSPRHVVLLHVIDPPDRPGFAIALLWADDSVEVAARKYAARRIRDIADGLPHGTVRTEVRLGKPSEQISTAAREFEADLVVIGPHGDRARPWKFLGTTADRVVRTSPVPVLVATNPGSSAPRRILTPVDDVSITPTVLEWTRDLAERWDADVTLLHVWSNALYSHVASMTHATIPDEDAARKEIRKELSDAAAHWLDEMTRIRLDRTRVTATVRYGNAGDIAVEMAAEAEAGLIVMGRRGSGLIVPALLGSTVGTVLHGARCPVLVVTDRV